MYICLHSDLWLFVVERGVHVARVMSGSFMTSLEMAGVSVSLMRVDEEILHLFGEYHRRHFCVISILFSQYDCVILPFKD